MKYSSQLTSKSQVVIPKVIRDQLRIAPGDRVVYRQEGDKVYIEAAPEVSDVFGMFADAIPQTNSNTTPLTDEKVKEIVETAVIKKYTNNDNS